MHLGSVQSLDWETINLCNDVTITRVSVSGIVLILRDFQIGTVVCVHDCDRSNAQGELTER